MDSPFLWYNYSFQIQKLSLFLRQITQLKKPNMKKEFLAICILCAAFVACNNSEKKEDDKKEDAPALKAGIWLDEAQLKAADPLAAFLYLKLDKNGESFDLSIPCDMDRQNGKLTSKDGIYESKDIPGIKIKPEGEALSVNFEGSELVNCQNIDKKSAKFIFLEGCEDEQQIANAVYFSGKFEGTDENEIPFYLKFNIDGSFEGWQAYTRFYLSKDASTPLLVFADNTESKTAYQLEVKGKNFDLYEVVNQNEALNKDTEIEKGKKLFSVIRK
jgi:hypothetical protein